MQVRVLGEVEAMTDGGPVRVGSRNQRIVLAVMAAQPGFAASADLLIDALWGDDPPASARATLRTYVSRLRRLVGGCVSIGPTGYALDLPCEEIDACRLEQLVDRAVAGLERSDPVTAVALLDEALELWRGVPFGDVGDLAAVRGAVARLEERRTAACEARSAALLAAGRTAEAIGAVEELVAQHPLRESAWAVLVEALADASRAPEALRAFQRASHALAEAGLEPSERLRKAEARALARQGPEISHRTLTVASSSLVGRDADVALVSRLLAEHRIVTLVGPGGVGKTRLALAVAAAVQDRFEWEARLVELAGVADPDAVPAVVAQGLGLVAHGAPPDEVLANAGQLDMLGVLDNCEHVIDAAARTVDALATGGPRLRLLVTSRAPLGVEGEQLWPVSPLATTVTPGDGSPDPAKAPMGSTQSSEARSPAHALFLDRARAVRPDLDPDEREREAIDRITRRLDGLPLAIEMAASQMATLPLVELGARLDDEVGVVVSRRRTAEPRHRTLAAVVEWSERLLADDERELFADMAVFEGSVRVEDVEAVTGRAGSLDVLARLAERSLLVTDVSGDRARFGMLRTIRDRSRRLLTDAGRAGDLSSRHAEHIVAALVQADLGLRGPDEADAHAHIEELLADARAAYGWASEHNLELARRLCGALFLFAQSRRRDEVLGWSAALASGGSGTLAGASGALVLAATAQRAVNGGQLDHAMSLAERAADAASGQVEAAESRALAHVHESSATSISSAAVWTRRHESPSWAWPRPAEPTIRTG